MTNTLPVSDILIGKRVRRDMGDISALAQSIEKVGLLHAIVVLPDKSLVAGQRRLLAVQKLGWKTVPVRCVETLTEAASVIAEGHENIERLNFTPGEAVAYGKELEKIEKPKAEERREQTQGRPKKGASKTAGNLPSVKTETRDVVGSAVGMSGKTYEKAKKVVQAVKDNPKLQPVLDEMEETRNVTKAFRKVQQSKVVERVAKIPPGKFRVFYADPPWKYGSTFATDEDMESMAAEANYPTMTIAELCALPVIDSAADDSVLFLWVTSPLLGECWPVIKAWGFQYKSSFVWEKGGGMPGNYNHVRHEFLLVCTRGSCVPDIQKRPPSVQSVKRTGRHSEKPEHFRELIDELYPHGRKVELFARKKANGWEAFGNEV